MKPWKRLPALLAALALACCSTACGPAAEDTLPPPSPSETSAALPTFEPLQDDAGLHATIAIYTMYSTSMYDEVVKRVNGYLATAGQAVEIELRNDPYGGYVDGLTDKIRTELEAGTPSADAYALDTRAAAKLFEDGLAADVSALLVENAPNYRAKYGQMFPEPLHGIPVCLYGKPLILRPALVLRRELTPTVDTGTIEGFLAFLDQDIRPSPEGWKIAAQPMDLVNQWALEQGFYALAGYGMVGGYYAALDENSITPVPLEEIPGFESFVERLAGLYTGGPLRIMGAQGAGASPAGMVKRLCDYYFLNPLVSLSSMEGQFTAYPFTPDLPVHTATPDYMRELVLPPLCPDDKAAAVARFVEWLYAAQDNYDLVVYGWKGLDFADAGGRFQPLLDGNPVQAISGESMARLVFLWPGAETFGNSEFLRLPSYAPDNLEKLIDEGLASGNKLPLEGAITAHPNASEQIAAVTEEMQSDIAQRQIVFNELLLDTSPTIGQIRISMELLHSYDNSRLTDAYARVLNNLREP